MKPSSTLEAEKENRTLDAEIPPQEVATFTRAIKFLRDSSKGGKAAIWGH